MAKTEKTTKKFLRTALKTSALAMSFFGAESAIAAPAVRNSYVAAIMNTDGVGIDGGGAMTAGSVLKTLLAGKTISATTDALAFSVDLNLVAPGAAGMTVILSCNLDISMI